MRLIQLLGTVLVMIFSFSVAAADCIVTMVYKDGAKDPLITAPPKNDGVYQDLFTEATKRIGCKLEITRLPKQRLHNELKKGTLDFYPGASFSKKRSKYLYYLPNGLDTGEYGVTNKNVDELGSYDDLKKYDAKWLLEIGSSKLEKAKSFGIVTQERKYLDLDLVSKYILRSPHQNYFYVADKELIDYFPRKFKKTLDSAGLKIHKNCCGGNQPMYMGFSRHSPHFKEQPNPDFDAALPLSPDNFPTLIDKSSIAYKLGEALSSMKSEGETDKIYKKWF